MFTDRARPLFLTLAGVGVTLLLRRTRPHVVARRANYIVTLGIALERAQMPVLLVIALGLALLPFLPAVATSRLMAPFSTSL
ncbi:MAG: hypothetical protein LH645_06345 [Actinomycetia bacterium]|nr:hypothetical protein [Actinomycetes bacterium]